MDDQSVDTTPYARDSPVFRRRKTLRRILAILFVLGVLGTLGRRFGPDLLDRIEIQRATRCVDTGQLDEAEIRLNRLISEKPRDTRARLLLVQLYRRERRITEAEEILQRAVELGLGMDEARQEHLLLRRLMSGREQISVNPTSDSRSF